MFAGKAGLERLAKDKHSSSLQKFVNYGRKIFIGLAPGGSKASGYVPLTEMQS
jgi:hypothetical protein